jgi:hypothetical protein
MSFNVKNSLRDREVVHANENYIVLEEDYNESGVSYVVYRRARGNGDDTFVGSYTDEFLAVSLADGANISKMEKELCLMEDFEEEFGPIDEDPFLFEGD